MFGQIHSPEIVRAAKTHENPMGDFMAFVAQEVSLNSCLPTGYLLSA
jgi:hypothetical protein